MTLGILAVMALTFAATIVAFVLGFLLGFRFCAGEATRQLEGTLEMIQTRDVDIQVGSPDTR